MSGKGCEYVKGFGGNLEALKWITFSWRFRAEICVSCGGPRLDFGRIAWIVYPPSVSVWPVGGCEL